MPRYFFDIDDGERQVRDEAGIDLASLGDVPRGARQLLFDLGYAEVLKGRDRTFTAVVRDVQGARVYKAEVSLRIEKP